MIPHFDLLDCSYRFFLHPHTEERSMRSKSEASKPGLGLSLAVLAGTEETKMRVWLIVVWIASFAPLVSERAEAAFVNGVETFDGQVLDTSTWQVRYNSVVVQNDALTIPSGEVVTAGSLVPVGGGVRVDVVVSQIPGVINNYPGAVSV